MHLAAVQLLVTDHKLLMRIIAGHYGGRRLHSPTGNATRPTSDRLRETLFNILAPRLPSARFLDLCAGTGAVGLEALSRGAAHATFVEHSRKMCSLIRQNLTSLAVPDEAATLFCQDVADFLRRVLKQDLAAWDVVYFDPPYLMDYAPVLELLSAPQVLAADGLVIAEHHTKKELPELSGNLRRWRYLRQGDASLSFYEHG